jgi:hypothetical protein
MNQIQKVGYINRNLQLKILLRMMDGEFLNSNEKIK